MRGVSGGERKRECSASSILYSAAYGFGMRGPLNSEHTAIHIRHSGSNESERVAASSADLLDLASPEGRHQRRHVTGLLIAKTQASVPALPT